MGMYGAARERRGLLGKDFFHAPPESEQKMSLTAVVVGEGH